MIRQSGLMIRNRKIILGDNSASAPYIANLIKSEGADGFTTDPVTTQSGSLFMIVFNTDATIAHSVSDSYGNTYVLFPDFASTDTPCVYYCENGVGGPGHTFTVVGFYATGTGIEIRGAATSSPIDVHNRVQCINPAPFADTITTLRANVLLIAFFVVSYSNGSDSSYVNNDPLWIKLSEEVSWSNWYPYVYYSKVASDINSYPITITDATGGPGAQNMCVAMLSIHS